LPVGARPPLVGGPPLVGRYAPLVGARILGPPARCLAPAGSTPGQEAVGTCSDHVFVAEETPTVTRGQVNFPMFSLEITDDKRRRLQELAENRAKWNASAVHSYSMTLAQSCFCFVAPATGPNRIVVDNGLVVRVTYRGETRQGYLRGGSLTRENFALRSTIDEMFEDLEVTISRMTSNAHLRVAYDDRYGFPTEIDFDRPDWYDEEYTLTVSDFALR
jgi:hypothetical protein